LKSQTAEKLTLVHAHIAVTSIEEFYEEGSRRDVILFLMNTAQLFKIGLTFSLNKLSMVFGV